MQNKSSLTAGSNHELRPALVLDLDGTIRQSKSGQTFIKDSDDIQIIPGVEEKIQAYKEAGWMIIGVTNQGGVAFGFKTPYQIEQELAMTVSLLGSGLFDVIRACYAMEGDGAVFPYNQRSLSRKPEIGMLAGIELDAWRAGSIISWNHSIFVGDRPEDLMSARKAGITFYQAGDFFENHPAERFAIPDNLNYDNIWFEAEEKYPDAMNLFSEWIDAWQKKNHWTGDKFHFWPVELQVTLLNKFFYEKMDSTDMDLGLDVKEYIRLGGIYLKDLQDQLSNQVCKSE